MKNVPLVCFINRLIQFEIKLDSAAWYYNVRNAFLGKSWHSSLIPEYSYYFVVKQQCLHEQEDARYPKELLSVNQALWAPWTVGWESGAIDSQHSAGSQPRQTHEFSVRAHSGHENKQSICKGSHKNLDELKEGWFFTKPLYSNLALSWILFKAGEREHLLENLES